MNWQEIDWRFWVAVLGAAIIRVMTSESHSFWRSITTVAAAVFAAWTFTDSALHWFNLPVETYRVPIAALLALTGEGAMRFVINIINDPMKALDFWQKWRGK